MSSPLLFLLVVAGPVARAQGAPAFCPMSVLTTCHNKMEKCTPTLWHGIDSLEEVRLEPLSNRSTNHVQIRSLSTPPSFHDTIARIIILSKKTGLPVPDPEHCVKAPPEPTAEGNCTTQLQAFFSDANATLTTAVMDSCGILSWLPSSGAAGGHLYAQWVHANEPKPSPPDAMCQWQPGTNTYREVGANPPAVRYFRLENLPGTGGVVSQTSVLVQSMNGSFVDTNATVHEVGAGTPGKIAWRARLFGGQMYRGIMRANSAGGTACCEVVSDKHTGNVTLKACPVLSWWAPDGSHSCWSPVDVPSENVGACSE